MQVMTRNKQIELETVVINEPGREAANTPWGWHLVLNLYECDPQVIQSEEAIKRFIVELCDLVEMRRFGDPVVINFGDDPRVTGYSMFQLIETSNIAGHFANRWDSAYLDIFSCKAYDPQLAAEFCVSTFKAKKAKGLFIFRD